MKPLVTNALILQTEEALPPPATEGDAASPGGGFTSMLPMLAIIAVLFYFVMWLPEKKHRRQREEMLGGLKKGDRVMTTSGLLGSVAMVSERVVTLQVADGVRLKFTRSAIQEVLEDEGASEKAEGAKAAG